jgi:hypothetical protein
MWSGQSGSVAGWRTTDREQRDPARLEKEVSSYIGQSLREKY